MNPDMAARPNSVSLGWVLPISEIKFETQRNERHPHVLHWLCCVGDPMWDLPGFPAKFHPEHWQHSCSWWALSCGEPERCHALAFSDLLWFTSPASSLLFIRNAQQSWGIQYVQQDEFDPKCCPGCVIGNTLKVANVLFQTVHSALWFMCGDLKLSNETFLRSFLASADLSESVSWIFLSSLPSELGSLRHINILLLVLVIPLQETENFMCTLQESFKCADQQICMPVSQQNNCEIKTQ